MDEKDFELAARLTDAEIERGIERAVKKESPPTGWDGVSCSVCGDDVSPPRLLHGYHTCIECQTRKEHLTRMRR